MKVGTDGVLLGAWCPISHQPSAISNTPFRVLDIGTGSGLIALMLAQRCHDAHIDAIDIDEGAVEQARENFERSVFSHQLSAYKSSLQDWQNRQLYDIVVSNPPYFDNSLRNPDKGRQTARHTDTLSYDELLRHSARLLNTNGQLALILPAEAEDEVRRLAERYSLYITCVTRVYSKASKPARRVLMAFIHNTGISEYRDPEISSLVLEDEKGGRSAAYSELCKEFYL